MDEYTPYTVHFIHQGGQARPGTNQEQLQSAACCCLEVVIVVVVVVAAAAVVVQTNK